MSEGPPFLKAALARVKAFLGPRPPRLRWLDHVHCDEEHGAGTSCVVARVPCPCCGREVGVAMFAGGEVDAFRIRRSRRGR